MIMGKVCQIGQETHCHCVSYISVLHSNVFCTRLSNARTFVPCGFVLTFKRSMADQKICLCRWHLCPILPAVSFHWNQPWLERQAHSRRSVAASLLNKPRAICTTGASTTHPQAPCRINHKCITVIAGLHCHFEACLPFLNIANASSHFQQCVRALNQIVAPVSVITATATSHIQSNTV